MIGSQKRSSRSSGLVCFLPKNVFFASWIMEFLPSCPWLPSWTRGLLLFDSLSAFLAPAALLISVVKVQLFPFTPSNSFVNCLAEDMPVRINQRRSHLFFLRWSNIDARFQRFDFLGSQCYLICSFPDDRLWVIYTEVRLLDIKKTVLCTCASELRPLHCGCPFQ